MSKYIIDNNSNELNTICYTPSSYIISKDLFFNSLSKRQIEMIRNNEKTKLLKSLKHLNFADTFEDEFLNLINNKIYKLSTIIINENNALKQIIKHWEKEIEQLKDISKELSISDIMIIECINAEKSGMVKNIFHNTTNTIEIKATYGLNNENSNYDVYTLTTEIIKNIAHKEISIKYLNGLETEDVLSDKKRDSQVLSDSEIERLKKISKKINDYFGTIKDFSFVIKENKIYILNAKEIIMPESQKVEILFPNILNGNYKITQTNVDYSDYSFYNFLYKTKIKTYSKLFFVDEKDFNLLLYNKNIFENKDIITNLIEKSAVFQYNKTWFNNYIFNIEESDNVVNYTYCLEIIRFFFKLYKEYRDINKNIEILKDEITTLENFVMHSGNNMSDLINYLNTVRDIIINNFSSIYYNEIFINLIGNIIKRKNNLETSFNLYTLLDFNIINDLNSISNQLSNEVKNILNSEDISQLESFTNAKVDLEIFYDTHKNYFLNLDKISIYKIIANWKEITIENVSNFKLQDKYKDVIKNVETLTVCKNQLYNIYNNILEKIGSMLAFNKEIDSILDIHYLTVNEIVSYLCSIPQKGVLNSMIDNRKQYNFLINIDNNKQSLTFNELIINFNNLQSSYDILSDDLTALLVKCKD